MNFFHLLLLFTIFSVVVTTPGKSVWPTKLEDYQKHKCDTKDSGLTKIWFASIKSGEKCVLKLVNKKHSHHIADARNAEHFLQYLREFGGHENLMQLYTSFTYIDEENEEWLCLVLEEIDGVTLDVFIEETKERQLKPSRENVRQIVTGVTNGLNHLHRFNIVFRDMKMRNILYNPTTGIVKLIDFGLTCFVGDCKWRVSTLIRMTPEIFKDEPIGVRSDIWSLGVIMAFILTSEDPYNDNFLYSKWKQTVKQGNINDAIEYAREFFPKFQLTKWKARTDIRQDEKDFVTSLLVVDPAGRPTAEEILKMPFLTVKN